MNFKNIILIICTFIYTVFSLSLSIASDTISITSTDGLVITADTYVVDLEPSTPVIVLFHQAGWSRGEYIDIAPKLNDLGFNCVAIDLRSGKSVNGVQNLTAKKARKEKLETRYIDALPDVISALNFVKKQFPENKIIAWGSSYSAALVLHVAGTQPDLIDGALSFAPGEYFSKQGKSSSWIKESAIGIETPVFITSARNEKDSWAAIYESIPSKYKTSFIPESEGNHGSRALWENFADHQDYWTAVTSFLNTHFPR